MLKFGGKVKARESQVSNCLEVEPVKQDGQVYIKLTDSKNKVPGAHLLLTVEEWNAHMAGVRNGDTFDISPEVLAAV